MNQGDTKTSCNSKSRRDFFKASGTALAASALAGVAVPHCHAAGDNTIKLALVGCGPRGTGAVADAFSTSGGPVKLCAVADVFEDRVQGSLNNLKKEYHAQVDVPPERRFVGFDAYKKAIDCLGPGDIAILATRAGFRPLHFEYAVQKGVNVFMEKSFAVDAPGVRRLLKAAEVSEKNNLKVGAGFMWRHSKARQEVIRRLHDGAIGDIHTFRIYRSDPIAWMPPRRPENLSELAFQIRFGGQFQWVGAGLHVDWHCHNIDVACWAKGEWPIAAQGFGGRCYPEANNLFDHYTVEYTFADGAKLFAFSRLMNDVWHEYADYAHGTKGSATIMASMFAADPRIYNSQKMTKENLVWRFGRSEPSPYHVEWQLLLDAIRQDKPHNEARRAAQADMTALMGQMATHTGTYLTWDEAFHSNFEHCKDIDHMTWDTAAPLQRGPDGYYPAPQPGITKEC